MDTQVILEKAHLALRWDLAATIGGTVGGTIGFLLFVVLVFCLWIRHKDKKKQKQKKEERQQGPHMQQLDSLPGVRPVNRSSYGGSDESFPGTAGYGQLRSPGHGPVPQSAGYSQTSHISSVYESALRSIKDIGAKRPSLFWRPLKRRPPFV